MRRDDEGPVEREGRRGRDSTTDDKLKELLTEIVPTLQKHEDTAQKLVDGQKK